MKKNRRVYVYLATGLIIILLLVYFQARDKNAGTADTAMLLDESATPAPHALIRLQERPVFQIDDRERPFAMIDDLDDRSDIIQAGDNPLTIQESQPN